MRSTALIPRNGRRNAFQPFVQAVTANIPVNIAPPSSMENKMSRPMAGTLSCCAACWPGIYSRNHHAAPREVRRAAGQLMKPRTDLRRSQDRRCSMSDRLCLRPEAIPGPWIRNLPPTMSQSSTPARPKARGTSICRQFLILQFGSSLAFLCLQRLVEIILHLRQVVPEFFGINKRIGRSLLLASRFPFQVEPESV